MFNLAVTMLELGVHIERVKLLGLGSIYRHCQPTSSLFILYVGNKRWLNLPSRVLKNYAPWHLSCEQWKGSGRSSRLKLPCESTVGFSSSRQRSAMFYRHFQMRKFYYNVSRNVLPSLPGEIAMMASRNALCNNIAVA